MHDRILKKILFLGLTTFMVACQSNHFVIDKRHILDANGEKNIEQLIATYHKRTGCSIYVYSIDKLPENVDASDYTKKIAKTLDLNKDKLDNSAIIFIALQDKKVILQPEYGFEWPIDAGVSQLIVNDLKMYFSKDLYKDGIYAAVKQIINLTYQLSWKVKPFNAENIKTEDIIELQKFHLLKSTNDSMIVSVNDSNTITIYTTKYMADLVKNLPSGTDSSATIYYRPLANDESKGYLINIVTK